MGTKLRPGKYDCLTKAEDDEPVFVLLARDPTAPVLIHHWTMLRRMLDCGDPPDKIAEAMSCAAAMESWANDHPDHGPFAAAGL